MFTCLISCHKTDLRKQNNVPGSWKLGQLGPRMMGDLKFFGSILCMIYLTLNGVDSYRVGGGRGGDLIR